MLKKKQTILITGGSGYVGSNLLLNKKLKNFNLIIIDVKKLTINKASNIFFFKKDFANVFFLEKLIKKFDIKTVVHLAAYTSVPDSMKRKKKYYNNNYLKSIQLINFCVKKKIKNFVFASSAAVYGQVSKKKVDEKKICNPTNNYGLYKLNIEKFLSKTTLIYAAIRFFNIAGANTKMLTGINSINNKSLINTLTKCAVLNKRFYLNGNDFDTQDGSSERDFIHIEDIIKIYKHLIFKNKRSLNILNCCTSKTLSLIKIVKIIEKIINKKIKYNLKKLPSNECVKIQGKKPEFMNYTKSHKSMIFSAAKWYLKF